MSFCIQKHAARRLHYDLRLELDGVLKSWAVPKGPSYDTAHKRLAVRTEDHPVEYGDFEGIIPAGEYGGGAVLLWDRGSWEPLEDPHAGLARGVLKFRLRGEKLEGAWALVKIKSRDLASRDKTWLLIKERDAVVRPGSKYDVTAARPESVVSGRELDAIAADGDRVWSGAKGDHRPGKNGVRVQTTQVLLGRKAALPRLVKPQLAKLAAEAPGTAAKGKTVDAIERMRMTHPERILYPASGLTKRDLAEFYVGIAEWILPHVAGRPTSLVRCPEGIAEKCFYQKHGARSAPTELRRVSIREKHKTGDYLVVENEAGLVALAQMSILEIHTWNSHADTLEAPDRIVFDLDPAQDLPWKRVVAGALLVRKTLEDLALKSFVKTTGGKGLHVVVPLERGPTWDETLTFTETVARWIAGAHPTEYVASISKAKRVGRIYIDYLRNQRGATSVCSYSTRAKESAPVSVPLHWDELDGTRPDFTMANVPARLVKLRQDPWRGYDALKQHLPKG